MKEEGRKQWIPLLKETAQEHDEHWLAFQLQANNLMKGFEIAQKPLGGYTTKHVPHTAAETLAEGQFNRFYILGLCTRANPEYSSSLDISRSMVTFIYLITSTH